MVKSAPQQPVFEWAKEVVVARVPLGAAADVRENYQYWDGNSWRRVDNRNERAKLIKGTRFPTLWQNEFDSPF
jgi:hypothetical protein